jgi:EipB-like
MLNRAAAVAIPLLAAFCCLAVSPLAAQDMASHRAAYDVNMLEHGKPGPDSIGTYAYELKATCDGGYAINQLLRLDIDRGRTSVVTEQQSQMTESRDGKKLTFDHRSMIGGKQAGAMKGDATLDSDGGSGQARFTEPAGQSIALPAGTMFPIAIARATVRHASAGDSSFDALFFYGEKVKPPQAVNVLIGKVPKRLADLAPPKGGDALLKGHDRIFYRGGFFEAEAKAKGEQAAFEMSSLMLDNGIELWGTHEEGDGGGIEYHITRLESLPAPTCK